MDRTESDSSCRELSNGGLGIVVALTIHWQIIFSCASTGFQSSCIVMVISMATMYCSHNYSLVLALDISSVKTTIAIVYA